MDIKLKRLLIYVFFCLVTRFMLAFTVQNIDQKYQPIFGIIFIILGASFFYLYFTDSTDTLHQQADTQLEWLGESKIWWSNLRPIHGFLFICAGILALNKNKYSYVPLYADLLFGVTSRFIAVGLY